jgi:hypothetical protein
VDLNFLQYESVEIKDDNNKKSNKEGNEDEDDSHNNKLDNHVVGKRKKKLDLDAIGNTIVGLKTYEVTVTEEQIMRYMDFTESHKDSNVNVWAFICGFVLLIINLVGKGLKNDYIEEY